jgi:hypothetical protein
MTILFKELQFTIPIIFTNEFSPSSILSSSILLAVAHFQGSKNDEIKAPQYS